MLVRKRNRIAYPRRLIAILVSVWLEQCNIALHLFISGIDIAENLRPGGIGQLLTAVNIDQRPFLLSLVAIEDPQRYVEAEAEGIVVDTDVVKRRIVRPPSAVGGVSRTVGYRQFVVRLRLLDGLKCCAQVGACIERNLAKIFQRFESIGKVKG